MVSKSKQFIVCSESARWNYDRYLLQKGFFLIFATKATAMSVRVAYHRFTRLEKHLGCRQNLSVMF